MNKIKLLLITASALLPLFGYSQVPSITYNNSALTFTTGSTIVPVFPTVTSGTPYALGQTITFAGSGVAGYANGTGTGAKFNMPTDIATDGNGNVYVADYNNGSIREITPGGVVTTFSGFGTTGEVNGTPGSAEFDKPAGLSVDAGGNIYVAESYGNRIRLITAGGVASILAGNGTAGYIDGAAANAEFNFPSGTATDASGNVYVADNNNHVIRKISTSGIVSTFAGNGTAGNANGTGTAAQFNHPQGLAIDAAGNIYVADTYNHLIRKISPAGVVTTLAGNAEGFANGSAATSDFFFPRGVTVDGAGNVYVADGSNNQIRKISPSGIVSTLAGNSAAGSADGTGTAASFNTPYGVAADANGNIYVADMSNNKIRKVITVAYTISPALPAGMVFDPATGRISGTPTVATGNIQYTITALNSKGSGNAIINLTVNQQRVFNPSQNQNYIATLTPRMAGDTSNTLLNAATRDKNQVEINVQYFDGLGRPIQTVQVKASPTGRDVVQPITYDLYGRLATKYLPYSVQPVAASDGSYKTTALTDQSAFYNNPTGATWNAPGVVNIPYPTSTTNYEPSPLNRIIEQGAPGDNWQSLGTPGVSTSAGHTIKTIYASNDNVNYSAILYNVNIDATGNRTLVNSGNYDTDQLYVTISQDENWTNKQSNIHLNTSEEYEDKEGHVVLKRTYNFNNSTGLIETLSTYYVYDDLENLCYVLPPLSNPDAGLTSANNQSILNNLCYQYIYDKRNRASQKKLPGKGWDFTVYNTIDQVVMTQDADQRNQTQQVWVYAKYDGMGRMISKGLWGAVNYSADTSKNNPSLAALQWLENLYASSTAPKWEARQNGTTSGYDGLSFPNGQINQFLELNFYDDYLATNWIPSLYGAPTNASAMTQGLITATFINVLGTQQSLAKVIYYDDLGRNIKTYNQHYLGGVFDPKNYDAFSTSYSFTNIPLMVTRQHYIRSSAMPLVIVNNQYIYDHMDRKLATWEQITTSNSTMATTNTQIFGIVYNELEQVSNKQLHSIDGSNFLQNIAYNYNERGWLLSSSAPLFQMQLQYNNVNTVAGITPVAQYNGNIASQSWGKGNMPNTNNVIYQYDNQNRLLAGNSNKGNSESNITYDLNGNIGTLNRYQQSNIIDQLTYTYNNANQLQSIVDNSGSSSTTGLVNGTTNYIYDNNGNLLSNSNTVNITQNKSYTYNMLNLPNVITLPTGTVTYSYDSNGKKLRKVSVINGTTKTTDYIDGIEYDNSTNTLAFIQTEEGKAVPWSLGDNTSRFDYTYYLGDNIGNTRMTFDTKLGITDSLQRDDYYPFGLEINSLVSSPKNEYLYNKKELQEELGQYDYGARFYDPVIARWMTIDPLAEKSRRWNPYNYVMDSPIRLIDVDGCDTAQRNAGIREARAWVTANNDGEGNTYKLGQKGKYGLGTKIDCSGLLSKVAKAGGESDPNHGDNGGGIKNIDNNLPSVDPKDVVPGNFVLIDNGSGKDSHGGVITSIERDKDGNIVNEKMIASGGNPKANKGTGPSGPKEQFIIKNGVPQMTIDSYKKWDSKPDDTDAGTSKSTTNTNTDKSKTAKEAAAAAAKDTPKLTWWQWLVREVNDQQYEY